MGLEKQRLEIAKSLSKKLKLPVNKIIELQKIQSKFVAEGMKQLLPIKLMYLGTFVPSQIKKEKRDAKREQRKLNEQGDQQIPSSEN